MHWRLLIERHLRHHSWVHPRLLELLLPGHSLSLRGLGMCGRVPDGVHLSLKVRSLLQMLKVVGRLLLLYHWPLVHDSHLLKLLAHRLLVHHLHVLLLQKLHVLELLLLRTISFSSLPTSSSDFRSLSCKMKIVLTLPYQVLEWSCQGG